MPHTRWQERDRSDQPKFRRSGLPAFAIRSHDVEEFVGVVRRHRADASSVRAIVNAVSGPEITDVSISQACGTPTERAA
ncbi:putative metallopeptidase [Mesorhizobium sp. L2C084A000]|uniref:putative metallopeptidase n=1 Tax=Mesorhizobium sp. L2C084A000 TaxID=1287116 RepID=UPI0009DDF359|nr:putative metallopeptidase [Mesorhizobium sp. L2C084A000]